MDAAKYSQMILDLSQLGDNGWGQVTPEKIAEIIAKVREKLPEDSQAIALAEAIAQAQLGEAVWPYLQLIQHLRLTQMSLLPKQFDGELEEIEAGPRYVTPMPTLAIYALVPETRPFAKRVKPEEQLTMLETTSHSGTVADLRLLQIYLKALTDKKDLKESPVLAAILELALPAFGKDILPELWPTLTPESRSFQVAYKLDIQATLTRLQEKSGSKKTDRGGPVIKAVEKLLEERKDAYGEVSVESLPILKLGLKLAPEANFRRKIAETLASMGEPATTALPELIDAFERGGLTRDYNLIQPMVKLGKESFDVAAALMRALEDRDGSVRMFAAFNLGQMGRPAMQAMHSLEFLSSSDPDPKVRDQATRTLNKLRARLEPATTDA